MRFTGSSAEGVPGAVPALATDAARPVDAGRPVEAPPGDCGHLRSDAELCVCVCVW